MTPESRQIDSTSTTRSSPIAWEIEKGRPPIQVYECADVRESAPAGHPILVTFTQVRVVTKEMANTILQLASTGSDGVPRATKFLHEAVGGYAPIGQCVAIVKEVKAHPAKVFAGDQPKLVLKNTIWMSTEDWNKYKTLPHIEAVDKDLRKEQHPPIESNIEWPETYDGGVVDPGGDPLDRNGNVIGDVIDAERPPLGKMPKRTGDITTISSIPTAPRPSGIVKRS